MQINETKSEFEIKLLCFLIHKHFFLGLSFGRKFLFISSSNFEYVCGVPLFFLLHLRLRAFGNGGTCQRDGCRFRAQTEPENHSLNSAWGTMITRYACLKCLCIVILHSFFSEFFTVREAQPVLCSKFLTLCTTCMFFSNCQTVSFQIMHRNSNHLISYKILETNNVGNNQLPYLPLFVDKFTVYENA